MATDPGPELPKRLPPTLRSVLRWVGIVLVPLLLLLVWSMLTNHQDFFEDVLWLAVVILPAGLLKHHPWIGLPIMVALALAFSMSRDPSWNITFTQVLVVQIAVGYVAATRRPRGAVLAAALVFLAEAFAAYAPAVTGTLQGASTREVFVGFAAMAGITAWIIGNSVRMRRKYAGVQREQAVNAERLRIARELHDMISHSIGVIAIQAGMGTRVIDKQPDAARDALATIEATSRDTLAQLRRTLGSLRRTEATPATFDPAPGLADLDRLVASTLDGGVRVDLSVRGQPHPIPADIDLSAYRIIQEALTNVVRHAGADACRVDLTYRDEELLIEITDEGTGSANPGAGFGIAGMRERVDMLHGEFSAGPRPAGGFSVTVRLLLPA